MHPPPEIKHAEAKMIGEQIAHEHKIAQSPGAEPMRRPHFADTAPGGPPYKAPDRPSDRTQARPSLDGAKSLREALEMVKKAPTPAPDLKETLNKIAPEARAEQKPNSLPEKTLREMLAVDEENIS